jgi:hypothetical protein
MRQRNRRWTKAAADAQIELIERRGLELYDGIVRRLKFRLADFFVAKLIGCAMSVNAYGLQKTSSTNCVAGSSGKFKFR